MTPVEVLSTGTVCLPCLASATGLAEAEIIDSLGRLKADVILAVGPCSRCGDGEDRLVCTLPAD